MASNTSYNENDSDESLAQIAKADDPLDKLKNDTTENPTRKTSPKPFAADEKVLSQRSTIETHKCIDGTELSDAESVTVPENLNDCQSSNTKDEDSVKQTPQTVQTKDNSTNQDIGSETNEDTQSQTSSDSGDLSDNEEGELFEEGELEALALDGVDENMLQQLFIDAMRLDDRRSVLKLLSLGIDVNSEYETSHEKKSLLYYAVDSGSLDMVKLLIERGAVIKVSSDPETRLSHPLHQAALVGSMPILKYFVEEHGLDVNCKEADNTTPLHCAAKNGSLALVKYLLDKGAKADALCADDSAPIHYAASRGAHQVVHELVRHGAQVNAVQVRYDHFDKKNDLTTSLILASCHGSYNVCEYLCMHGADVNWQDNEGWTALHNAACFNYPYIVDLLLKYGANVNIRSKDNDTPIIAAVHGDRTRTVQQLFKGGADINMTNGRGNTVIYESTSRYHTFSCWALLDCGVVVNTKENIRKFTDTVIGMKLHEKIDLKDTIRLMLEAGALMETEWLITLAGSYIVHHCLSLNRMFKHVTIPRTLQSCCHLVIRKHIKKPISEHLCELPLPQKVQDEIALINYVNFRPNSWRWGGDSDYWKRCY